MAGTNLLTDTAIRAALKAAAQSGKPIRAVDGAGMHLEARPNGSGWWRLRYRFEGRALMLSLGVYPDVGLALARQRRQEARSKVAAGVDPSAERKASKAAVAQQESVAALVAAGEPVPGTFEHVAREWLGVVHRAKVSEGHADRTQIRFEQDVFPWIGARHIDQLEPPELLTVIRRIVARGAIETAHRAKDACGQVFRYGIAAGVCTRNPAADLRDALPPVTTRHHAAIVDPKRAAELLRAMGEYNGNLLTRAALQLSALLFLRPGELRQLEWSWVDWDEAVIELPSDLMKRSKQEKVDGGAHLVPLAPQALAILREVQTVSGDGRYVFPSLQTEGRPMSENTVNVALRRLGYSREEMTAHGFRAMARTMAVERLGIDVQVVEAQLAHAVPDALGRAYNRTQFREQRRELMTCWADYLDRLRAEGHQTAKA